MGCADLKLLVRDSGGGWPQWFPVGAVTLTVLPYNLTVSVGDSTLPTLIALFMTVYLQVVPLCRNGPLFGL